MGVYGADLFPDGVPAFSVRIRNADSEWMLSGSPEDGTDEVWLSLAELAGAKFLDCDDITGAILFHLRDGRRFWLDSIEFDYHATADKSLDHVIVVD